MIANQLKTAGFQEGDISALFPDEEGSRDFAHEQHTKAPEGAAAGVAGGMVVGGALGWMIGIGAHAVPGIGAFIAAGPLMAALAGAAAGGAAGGVEGALIGLGIPEYEAKRYEGKIRDGNILMSVHTSDRDQVIRAKEIFKNGGADDISYAGEASVPKENHKTEHDRANARETQPYTETDAALSTANPGVASTDDYGIEAGREYDRDVRNFEVRGRAEAQEAEAAAEGHEGEQLRRAEQIGKSRPKGEDLD
jgi:hypothetical protein